MTVDEIEDQNEETGLWVRPTQMTSFTKGWTFGFVHVNEEFHQRIKWSLPTSQLLVQRPDPRPASHAHSPSDQLLAQRAILCRLASHHSPSELTPLAQRAVSPSEWRLLAQRKITYNPSL
ncbi:hypothetical protein LR48_Vigan07g148800 [Vigna angularis]|uniref:Uncharacterized protein n=1 Tax=Phaseolus angularis TaxID=3914 RepID=A0A0L9UZ03_PHAAN|nr:hypothetical protein LR48_Vigan07g148800 [Vigna angularis]